METARLRRVHMYGGMTRINTKARDKCLVVCTGGSERTLITHIGVLSFQRPG